MHYTAVEVDLGDAGKGWHYAALSRRGGRPAGACREHPPHPTEAEARTCYQQYLRTLVRLDVELSWTSCRWRDTGSPDAVRCPNPTRGGAAYGAYHLVPLCPEHLTPENALIALGLDAEQAGDSWES